MSEPDALGLREEVAEVLLRKFQTPETEWAKRDLMSGALADADALLPLIERREAEAAERALRGFGKWVATNRAYNGSDHVHGQSLYNECLNAVLTSWATDYLVDRIGGTQ